MMDVGRLIEFVRRHVFLYDISHKDYKNPSLKTATWELIARELNETGEACRHKWKTVRDSYTKHKRLLKSSDGTKEIDYIWSSNLKFLDNPNVKRRKVHKSDADADRKSDSISSASKQLEGSHSQSQDELTSMLSVSLPPLVPLGPLTTFADVGSATFQSSKDLRTNVDDQSTKLKEIDATDLLFLSYSGTFKTFSARQQALLKLELAKLFANAELEQLDNAQQSRVEAAENCLPVIIKTEYTERRASQSEISGNFNDKVNPAKRLRRTSTPNQ